MAEFDQHLVVIDNEPPDLTCPPDARVTCGEPTTPTALGEATAKDNCAVETLDFTDLPTRPHPDGCQFIRRWRAIDFCGNAATCDQTIVIAGWDRTYGSMDDDYLRALARTPDGYLMAGSRAGAFHAQRTTRDGAVTWTQTYSPGQVEAICPTPDGYLLAGTSTGRLRAVTIDAGGAVLADADLAAGTLADVAPTADGGCILAGQTATGWLAVKLDADGNETWRREVEGQALRAIAQTADGAYFLGGGADDYVLVRLDSAGGAEWRKTYGGRLLRPPCRHPSPP